ncbi:MAG TPA: DNA-3-methyladenine glycosylase [Dermatophilaceae bacterium]|nr:DNA-3-methyladenine glycosylase [Dermatophilaceae bacterium]
MSRLPRSFFARPVLEVAPDLLGCVVRHAGVGVRLTEVEAYDGLNDPGSHAFRGLTSRTSVMFGPPGVLYVYFTYGMHFCANLVCGPAGLASAVLLRAGEVVCGVELARSRRTRSAGRVVDRDLARGPARLAQALALGSAENGTDVCAVGSPFTVTSGAQAPDRRLRSGPRVGVSGPGGDPAAYPWRFWLDGEASVSAYRVAKPRRSATST